MIELEIQIRRVQDKLLELVKSYQSLKKENSKLISEVASLKKKETLQREEMEKMLETIQVLKASAGRMDEADQKEFEKHINQYIKEIDHCIGMLSD